MSHGRVEQLRNKLLGVTNALSEILITQLTHRDELTRDNEVMNEFIGLFLSLQRKQREACSNPNWLRRGTHDLKYLHTVVPYFPCESGQPAGVLGDLSKILKAMLDNNVKVPEIVNAYISKVIHGVDCDDVHA